MPSPTKLATTAASKASNTATQVIHGPAAVARSAALSSVVLVIMRASGAAPR